MLLLVTHINRVILIGYRWFSLGGGSLLTVIEKIAFMPILVLSARLCSKGIETTFLLYSYLF